MARFWEAKLVAALYVALAVNKRRKVKEIGKLRTGKMTLPTGGIHAADK
jgi:hypothetical protein